MIHCPKCGHQASVTAGTIFHGTQKPLQLWFHIIWWVVAQKTGANVYNLMDFMGFGSYETAWSWLQKLQRAMVRQGRDKLSGIVEVDKTFIGGIEVSSGKQGHGAETKTLIVVATECIGKQIGRVRFQCIEDASANNLLSFIEQNIEHESTVITDGWTGYAPLSENKKYILQVKVIAGSAY